VAVIGAGIAGQLLVHELGEVPDLVLISDPGAAHAGGAGAPAVPAPASSRALGIVARGPADNPARLAEALGADAAERLWSWSAASVGRTFELARRRRIPCVREGVWRAFLDEREEEDWRRSEALLRGWGESGDWVSGDEFERISGARGFRSAYLVRGDGGVLADALGSVGEALFRPAMPDVDWDSADAPQSIALLGAQSGVLESPKRIRAAARIGGRDDGAVRIEFDDGGNPLWAEIVVVAAGVRSPSVHPWFGPMLYPVRLQAWRSDLLPPGFAPRPVLCRDRHEAWMQDSGGQLAFVGCRWAEQPEMEAGVTDDTAISARVGAKMDEFLARHVPGTASGGSAQASWTGIEAFSCDGLPIVGSLPGDPQVIALCGWNGWALSFVAQAAADVAAMILGSGGEGPPRECLARRMI
jgi:glycine/D-amino acid oxidase-like deaminating enzyme